MRLPAVCRDACFTPWKLEIPDRRSFLTANSHVSQNVLCWAALSGLRWASPGRARACFLLADRLLRVLQSQDGPYGAETRVFYGRFVRAEEP
jgi:hypothetical protein